MTEASSSASQPFFLGIAGGTASGKTTVCSRITQSLGGQRVVLLSIDEFYRDLTPEECANIGSVNFDEPAAFDVKTMVQCLDTLKAGEAADVPVYDFVTSKRDPNQVRHVTPADVVIVEGILVLFIPELRSRFNMKIYVDTDDDVRLARRIRRDTMERGRDVESVIQQYVRFVKPSFDKFVYPSKLNADVIIPWREENPVAVDLITQHVRTKLSQTNLTRVYRNLDIMPATMQTRGMHTVIRDRSTKREDFVFYADRLIRLVVEHALGALPFQDKLVTTPAGCSYQGVSFSRRLCGVSIIRSGEAMENALRACCAGIRIGKILVTGADRADLSYEKLPHDISQRHVVLMDPILASGQGVKNAIERLTTLRNVPADRIILLSLIAAPRGIHNVCNAFPDVKVITSEIDEYLDEEGYIRPGIGDFGDRYFGTAESDDYEGGGGEVSSRRLQGSDEPSSSPKTCSSSSASSKGGKR